MPPQFTIDVEPVNFEATEDLEGKQNVPGYGHWHVFVDTPMGAMILMPGTDSFEVDLSEWGPGEHTIFIEPVQNDHTNFAEFGHVEFTVTVEPAT